MGEQLRDFLEFLASPEKNVRQAGKPVAFQPSWRPAGHDISLSVVGWGSFAFYTQIPRKR